MSLVLYIKSKNQESTLSVKQTLVRRGITLCAAILMIFFSVNNPAFARLNGFQWDAKVLEGFHREGIVLTFVKSAMSAHVSKPNGYSRGVVEDYLAEYKKATKTSGTQPVNIMMFSIL